MAGRGCHRSGHGAAVDDERHRLLYGRRIVGDVGRHCQDPHRRTRGDRHDRRVVARPAGGVREGVDGIGSEITERQLDRTSDDRAYRLGAGAIDREHDAVVGELVAARVTVVRREHDPRGRGEARHTIRTGSQISSWLGRGAGAAPGHRGPRSGQQVREDRVVARQLEVDRVLVDRGHGVDACGQRRVLGRSVQQPVERRLDLDRCHRRPVRPDRLVPDPAGVDRGKAELARLRQVRLRLVAARKDSQQRLIDVGDERRIAGVLARAGSRVPKFPATAAVTTWSASIVPVALGTGGVEWVHPTNSNWSSTSRSVATPSPGVRRRPRRPVLMRSPVRSPPRDLRRLVPQLIRPARRRAAAVASPPPGRPRGCGAPSGEAPGGGETTCGMART